MTDEIDEQALDMVAKSLPLYPPLKPGGDVTISEMLPELSNEELDYVMKKYNGTMKLGIQPTN